MISSLIRTALANRLLVLIFLAAVVGAGYLSFRSVPIDSFPDVTPSMVQVFTSSPGLSPVDVETLISYPIEISMYGLPNLERVQSTSIFGLSRVNIYFEDGTDIYFARRLVMERLAKAREEIPSGLGNPQLGPITTGLGRVFMYTLENKPGADNSPMELREAQDWIVKPQLRTVPGVTDVLSIGGYEKQYQVKLDPQALAARNLTIGDVRGALASNNRNVGASFIQRGGEEYIIRGYGWIDPGTKGLDDLRNVLVVQHEGTPVYIRDIAEVDFGPAIRRGALMVDGKEGVGGYVFKLIGANTQDLLAQIEAKVESLNQSLPEGMVLNPYYTQGDLVEKAVGTVEKALLEAAVLILVLLYLFLGNVRSTLIVIASLPVSVLVAFIAMDYVGMSANLMSLGGLAIGIGMMVDGSVVMIENISRHIEERAGEDVTMLRLVSEAAREVAQPITFAIAIIVIVFLPLFTLEGVEGKMFSPMAYTISFALAGSLLMALVLVPVMVSLLFKPGVVHGEPRIVGWLKQGYRPILNLALRFPVRVVAIALSLFAIGLGLFPTLGSEFVPTLREGTFLVRSTLPPGANLDTANDYAGRVSDVMREFPEVTGVYARVGRAEVGGDPEPVNVVASLVTLKPLDEWESGLAYEELQSAMAERVAEEVPGLASNFSQPIQLSTDELLSGILAEVAISIYGDDLDELAGIGEQITEIVREVPGAVDVRMQQQDGKPQVVIRPDRSALARYGIPLDEVLGVIETGIGGSSIGQVFEGVRRFDIFTRLDEEARQGISNIEQLQFRTSEGALIPLSRIADIEVYRGPKNISRDKASRRLSVQLNVRGRDMGVWSPTFSAGSAARSTCRQVTLSNTVVSSRTSSARWRGCMSSCRSRSG